MKKYCALIFCLLLLTSTALAQDKAPKLVVEAFEHDFGKIKEGVKATHTFNLKNEGDADLRIDGVAPS